MMNLGGDETIQFIAQRMEGERQVTEPTVSQSVTI